MQIFLSRAEIRRQMRACLGQTTDEGLAAMNRAALDVHIQAACLQAHSDMRPLKAQLQETFDLGIQQSLIEYPDDAGPGALLEAAIYSPTAVGYVALKRKRRRPINSDDQALVAGGTTMDAIVGEPKWIAEEADGWRFFPTTDQAYKVRVTYAKRQIFNDDDELSTVDAQLIISWALHVETSVYDKAASERHLGDYERRKMQLKGWEQTGAAIHYDADCTFDTDPDAGDEQPNWDTRASRQ